jgi:hypothetical protein
MKDIEITDELIDKWIELLGLHEQNFKNKNNLFYALDYCIEISINKKINHDVVYSFLRSIFIIYNEIYFNISQSVIRNKINQMANEVEDQYNITKNWIFSNEWFRDRLDVDLEFAEVFSEKHKFNIRLEKKYHGNNR